MTGQVFFRKVGQSPDGRDIMAVVGIVTADPELKGEHQYTVSGGPDFLTIHPDAIDRTEEAQGQSLNVVLTSPIWRV